MKKMSTGMRIFYIVLVPIILVVVLLNSGLLQTWLTAADAGGKSFTAARYNYYYFSVYNEFIETRYADLASLGFDQNSSPARQDYDGAMTWQDYFISLADRRLARAVLYNRLAEQEGYTCSREELAPAAARLEEIAGDCAKNGLSAANYYAAYYGSGMTEALYTEELYYETAALAYESHLLETQNVTEEELDAWLVLHPPAEDYPTADVDLIVLSAVPDRFTGQVGAPQLDDLAARLHRLEARWQARPSDFASLAGDFSIWSRWRYEAATREDLPAQVADWCFARQTPGSAALVDDKAGLAYLAVCRGYGGSAARDLARRQLQREKLAEREEAELAAYPVRHHTIGMLMAAR